MFWSGNYITVRELNALLKEENVTLTQVLEADDILQECQTDNQPLIQFLTRPDILSELVSLITEEPPKNVELASQYRHASIACEVLTSHLATLPDRLSADTVLMHRLCDFINCEPPLNPLLASYFSKTIEMLLDHSPKQDWYTYQIVCLRVLDFLKARRDFLPNLLRHFATSAVADVFKYFIRLDDLFSKTVLEWLEEHEFLECLIQIICGTYEPEPLVTADPPHTTPATHNHDDGEHVTEEGRSAAEARCGRARRAAAADNALALLCDLVLSGDAQGPRARTWSTLGGRLSSAAGVGRVLAAAAEARGGAGGAAALGRAARLLLALLRGPDQREGECEYMALRAAVEQAVAPHLPLLHQALLRPPTDDEEDHSPRPPEEVSPTQPTQPAQCEPVGEARVSLAALVAALAASEVADVPNTLLALGTPALLLRLMFSHEHNNFLHAHVAAFVRRALDNWLYAEQYADHLFVECDLLTKLMDAYEENEEKKRSGGVRSGYMGHVVQLLGRVALALTPAGAADPGAAPASPTAASGTDGDADAAVTAPSVAPPCGRRPLPGEAAGRWPAFVAAHRHTLQLYDLPLGGYYPSENAYEYNNTVVVGDDVGADCPIELVTGVGEGEGGEGVGDGEGGAADALNARNTFLELASQRFDDNMWDDAEPGEAGADVHADMLADVSPWEAANEESNSAGEGWASFGEHFSSDPFSDNPPGIGRDPAGGQGVGTHPAGGSEAWMDVTDQLAELVTVMFGRAGLTPDHTHHTQTPTHDTHTEKSATHTDDSQPPPNGGSQTQVPVKKVTEHTETESGTKESTSKVAETRNTEDVTELPTAVTELPMAVTESQSAVTESESKVTEWQSNVTEWQSNVTESLSNVTESPSNVTESPSNVTESPSNVTESLPTASEPDPEPPSSASESVATDDS